MKFRYFTIPNILTLCNLLCGTIAIVTILLSMSGNYGAGITAAFFLIVASAVFDFFDGFAARLLKQYSPLGVQLDSLSDMVSFGVAPSVIMVSLAMVNGVEGYWWLLCLSIALFSALRLARFNIDDDQHSSFVGLPTPACALFVASGSYFLLDHDIALNPWIVIGVSVVLALLLIAPVRMFSLKFHGFSPRDPMNLLRYIFLLVGAAMIIIWGFGAVAGIIILYILTSLILNMVCRKGAKCEV